MRVASQRATRVVVVVSTTHFFCFVLRCGLEHATVGAVARRNYDTRLRRPELLYSFRGWEKALRMDAVIAAFIRLYVPRASFCSNDTQISDTACVSCIKHSFSLGEPRPQQ